jgi:hypothetical protein
MIMCLMILLTWLIVLVQVQICSSIQEKAAHPITKQWPAAQATDNFVPANHEVPGIDSTSANADAPTNGKGDSPPTVAAPTASASNSVLATAAELMSHNKLESTSNSVLGSSVAGVEHPATAHPRSSAPQKERAVTQSQQGIHKPKLCTYGTVRYGFLTSTGEPENTEVALHDTKLEKCHGCHDISFREK